MNVRRVILGTFRAARATPFKWGEADCLCFAADCALAITGRDPAHELRGTYDSDIGAKRIMIANGWESMGDVAASMFTEIPVAQAVSGDWAYVPQAGRGSIGVVIGDMIAAKSEEGAGQVRLGHAQRAFRVA